MSNRTLNDWIDRFGNDPIPAIGRAIKELRRVNNDERRSVHEIVEVVERDPGLSVFVLRLANNKKRSSLSSEVTSVQQAVMLLGTGQLQKIPEQLPDLEKSLPDAARMRLLKTFSRTYHAAYQALAWARERRDMTPDEVFAAAQLHFLGEMALAIHAPELLDQIDQMCIEQHLPSEEAQYVLLGFTLDELTLCLAEQWHLPELLKESLQAENARFPRAYGIMLAVQLGRHAAINWYSKKTREIEEKVAEWLGRPLDEVIARSHQLAAHIANTSYTLYQVAPAAALLPLIAPSQPETRTDAPEQAEVPEATADICLMPQLPVIRDLLQQLSDTQIFDKNPQEIIETVIESLHHGLGLNRVVFARQDPEKRKLIGEKVIGSNNDPVFSRFEIDLSSKHLFSLLMEKTQAILINDQTRQKFWSLVPADLQKKIKVNSFIAMSLYIHDQPLGLIYADRHSNNCQIDENTYRHFKTVCKQLGQVLVQIQENNPQKVL
ncbi:HDOD domain-containing protein [Thiohalophilus sp.]|uniref:HDOD domain-containing protein n=1 Tax=Thiohalophilus sp. TaxID=3028392 RepID=UPI003976982A